VGITGSKDNLFGGSVTSQQSIYYLKDNKEYYLILLHLVMGAEIDLNHFPFLKFI
jgi:hypothetical protein